MKKNTKKIVLAAILTAIVVILQFFGAFVRFGPFSISLVLVPIVIGASTCGVLTGGWLGFVFGTVVLLNGDAAPFLAVNPLGTILTVLLKGIGCGLASGAIYNLISERNKTAAVIMASAVCPIVNTGIFLIGCSLFFMDTITGWAEAAGFGGNVVQYVIFAFVGFNFLFEFLVNLVLSPIIVRLINLSKKVD